MANSVYNKKTYNLVLISSCHLYDVRAREEVTGDICRVDLIDEHGWEVVPLDSDGHQDVFTGPLGCSQVLGKDCVL